MQEPDVPLGGTKQPEQDSERAIWRLVAEPRCTPRACERKPRILVVDDESLHRESLSTLLSMEGYVCNGAEDGSAAIDALSSADFDLILLDQNLAGAGGHGVLRFLNQGDTDISFIILSDESTWSNPAHTLCRGAQALIRKPYRPDQVISEVKKSLEKQRQRLDDARLVERQRISEHLHRLLVDQSPDLIFVLDRNGRFQFVNDQFRHLLGCDKEQVLGRHLNTLLAGTDSSVEKTVLDTGDAEVPIRDLELCLKRNPATADQGTDDSITVELSAEKIYSVTRGSEARTLVGVYGVARDVTKMKRTEALVRHQAYHDLLTGLPNRALFNDRLERSMKQAQREGGLLAVMFLDLDGFKQVNDTLGHGPGDRLLKGVAERIQGCIRQTDTLSRIGGDEFLVLLPQIKHPQDAVLIAEKMTESLLRPLSVDDHQLCASASIGIALYPQHGETPDVLIKHADMAMYEVKDSGRGSFRMYSPALNQKYIHKLDLDHGLRNSLANNHFELHYQPLVRISDRRLTSMEALLRWRHPVRGLLNPSDFVAAAEENGTIIDIGRWVLNQALADLRGWLDSGLQPAPLSINVSAVQLDYPGFVEQLRSSLQRFRLPGDMLQIEFTENILMESKRVHSVITTLNQLCRLGIEIAIDDFGSGYSSLSHLRELPIHILKVDPSFLEEIDATANARDTILRAIAVMARGLELRMVAEGVEREVQADYLSKIGCDCAQGFLFSKPLSRRDATRYLTGCSP